MKCDQQTLLYFVSVDNFFCSHFLARAKAAKDAGYNVLVLTKVISHGAQIEEAELRLIPLEIDRRSINPIAALRTLYQIICVYKNERPALVHHVALKPILLGSLAARLVKVPNVVNALVGGGYAFTSKNLLMRLVRPILQLAMRVLLNPPRSRVVFENVDDLKACVEARQVRQEDAILIRGAGVHEAQYQAGGPQGGIPIVVLGARLLWDKGIGEFVEASSILRDRGINARFAIVGGADPDNRANIDADTLATWKNDAVVEFWGYRNDMPDVLAQATIACLPSYREGLPKFLLDAMASSLPCVTTDAPGCREAVRDGDNGLLVPVKNVGALADALQKLLLDPKMCRRMGLRGRQRVEQEFASKLIVDQTLALYKAVLSE